MTTEIQDLEKGIAALEAQRTILGDAVVDPMIAAAQEKLNALRASQAGRQRKQVTVLFADVSGFTAMSETMDPEEVSDTMNMLWSRLDAAILNYGGAIDKHIGDAVMALFGTPVAREDDPERAIRAALAMQDELRAFAAESTHPPLKMRIGINTGLVLLGDVGTQAEYTAMGDAVNLASRLEHAAPVGGILIAHNTYRHVRGIFDVQALEPIKVKGKEEPVRVYTVQAVKPRAFYVPTRGVEGLETRMIGRETELKQLRQALETVIQTQATHMVTVVGDAGVGKSRLLYEFNDWLESLPDKVLYFKGRADQRTINLPFVLFRDLFSFQFAIKNSDRGALAKDKLEQGIMAISPTQPPDQLQMWAHFIGQLIGLDFSESPYLRGILTDTRQIHDRAFHYAVQFFETMVGETPAVLFLEDLHWADSGSLDLIEYLASHCEHTPLLIVALTRPDFFEQYPSWCQDLPCHTRIDLTPLSELDSQRLVDEILRKMDHIPDNLRELVVARAGGNPFYIEELIKMLIEEKIIIKEADQWHVEPENLADVRIPQTLIGVLQARLDGLLFQERVALQCASVIGRVFWNGAVRNIAELAATQGADISVQMTLRELCERELIFKREPSVFIEEQEYIFKHPMLHDITYESVLKQQRRAYHAQVAEWLIEQSGERTNEYAGLIGGHFERAGDSDQAAYWYGQAARQAQEAYAPETAIEYYQKALKYLTSEGEETGPDTVKQQIELYRGLGLMLRWRTQFAEASDIYQAMLDAAQRIDDQVAQALAWEGLSLVHQAQDDPEAALASARQAEFLARALGKPGRVILARVLCNQGWALADQGDIDQALALGEQVLVLNRTLWEKGEQDLTPEAQRVIANSLNLLGWAHRMLGHHEEATRYTRDALAVFKELDDRIWIGGTLNNLGVIVTLRGHYQEAVDLCQESLSTAREIGHRHAEIVVLSNLGSAWNGLENYEAAEANLRQAVAIAKAVNWQGFAEIYAFLAEACIGQGKVEEAREAALQALSLAQESVVQEEMGRAWRALALVLSSPQAPEYITVDGEVVSVETCFERSLKIFEAMGMEIEQARILRDWAKYTLAQGDRARAQTLWQTACEHFAGLGMDVDDELESL